jgi:hypothetical protein
MQPRQKSQNSCNVAQQFSVDEVKTDLFSSAVNKITMQIKIIPHSRPRCCDFCSGDGSQVEL